MKRRDFLKQVPLGTVLVASAISAQLRPQLFGAVREGVAVSLDAAQAKDWWARWEKNILNSARSRYCDKEMGEELGWLVSPILNGFYYGYLATHDSKWVERLIEWTDACITRAVKEPDDFLGWPKGDGGGGDSKEYSADSLLGEAMMLRPVVLMADEILKTAPLKDKWGSKAQDYLELARQIFQKWDSRDCWRE